MAEIDSRADVSSSLVQNTINFWVEFFSNSDKGKILGAIGNLVCFALSLLIQCDGKCKEGEKSWQDHH
jgi:hypothetical protein